MCQVNLVLLVLIVGTWGFLYAPFCKLLNYDYNAKQFDNNNNNNNKNRSCEEAMKLLKKGESALEAISKAIVILEVRKYVILIDF